MSFFVCMPCLSLSIFFYTTHTQPFKLLLLGLKWMLTEMIIELSRIGMWVQSSVIHTDYGNQEYEYEDFGMTQKTTTKTASTMQKGKGKSAEAQEAEDYFRAKQEKLAAQVVTVFYACDRKADLYDINEVWVRKNGSFSLNEPKDGARYENFSTFAEIFI